MGDAMVRSAPRMSRIKLSPGSILRSQAHGLRTGIGISVCTLCRFIRAFIRRVLAGFNPYWPFLISAAAPFGSG
jgi:hypothetical protein